MGRGGKETRITLLTSEIGDLVNGASAAASDSQNQSAPNATGVAAPTTEAVATYTPAVSPTQVAHTSPVSVTTSPSVHVNVEIHIAADATADTVREIFKNMARYVLDKPVTDDID